MTNGTPNILNSRGDLQVSTYIVDAGKPINNVVVRISPPNNRQNILAELFTNLSGQTEVIDLPAPPLEYSLSPSGLQPYSQYDVSIFGEGFKPVFVSGVQILPDTLSYLNVSLFPDIQNGSLVDVIGIAPNTLYGDYPPKIPEDPVKPLPKTKGLVVLSDVVVPEFVIVHDGVPTDTSAPNYWVTFENYIKNVASCEIYSTWPESAIRANILAILSFTLNRVYSEWYQNKGFPFTITSSTAFDQKFVYGRNIYAGISNTVDQIFTSFITRPNIRQPLLTQYCDGSKTFCPGWLSQWGSKSLAEEGYGAIDILKYYYGSDIYLMTAQKVEGVPVSYPGIPLQIGSTGADVRAIQMQLNAISNNYPAIPKLKVDGIYGAKTMESVEIFQEIFALPVTGIIDSATWYKISYIYVAVTKIAQL